MYANSGQLSTIDVDKTVQMGAATLALCLGLDP